MALFCLCVCLCVRVRVRVTDRRVQVFHLFRVAVFLFVTDCSVYSSL